MTIYLGADHDGWLLKEKIKLSLQKQGYKVSDQGNLKHEADDDYPDYAKRVALMMKKNKDSRGILCCDSGQGMLMAANRFQHLRAAFAHSEASIKQARQDEDVNVLCLMTNKSRLSPLFWHATKVSLLLNGTKCHHFFLIYKSISEMASLSKPLPLLSQNISDNLSKIMS